MLRTRVDWCRLTLFIVISAAIAIMIFTTESTADTIDFALPGEGSEVTTSKPQIVFAIDIMPAQDNLLVLLDDIDITGVLDLSSSGFTFDPVQPLENGQHQLDITVFLDDGSFTEQTFTFHTFTKISSQSQASAIYEQVLDKSNQLDDVPHNNFAANIGNTMTFNEGNWQTGLSTNLRWLDRSTPVFDPEKKRGDVINYLIFSQYHKDDTGLLINVGDVQIEETRNTVTSLARRGVQANFIHKDLSLNAFVVRSEQLFGVDDGSGLEFDDSKYINGISGSYSLFSEALKLSTIYVSGSEEGNSYGIYASDNGNREGSVLGFLMRYQLPGGKLNIDAEYDISDYDASDSDQFSSQSDRAWSLVVGGITGSYSYQALYDYVGPDYEVIGNPWLQRDREGFTLAGSVQKAIYSLNLSASRFEDNVDEDKLTPQTVATTISVDYSFNRFPNVPMGFSYQKALLDSNMVPDGELPYKTDTDFVSANIVYLRGLWSYGMTASYSSQDDKTPADYDTTAQTYNFYTTYYTDTVSFAPNLTFNRATDETSGVDTDTLTASIDLLGKLYRERVSYELAGIFTRTEINDGTLDMDIYNVNARVAYHFLQEWAGFFNPSVGIRGTYNLIDDRELNNEDDDFVLMLTISTNMDFTF